MGSALTSLDAEALTQLAQCISAAGTLVAHPPPGPAVVHDRPAVMHKLCSELIDFYSTFPPGSAHDTLTEFAKVGSKGSCAKPSLRAPHDGTIPFTAAKYAVPCVTLCHVCLASPGHSWLSLSATVSHANSGEWGGAGLTQSHSFGAQASFGGSKLEKMDLYPHTLLLTCIPSDSPHVPCTA
jgi:hypothetical protein